MGDRPLGSPPDDTGAAPDANFLASMMESVRRPHPGDEYEALPDDASRPSEVTIRPRYADDTTTAWVSASVEDVISLQDAR